MVHTFDHIAECTLAYHLLHLVSETYLVALLESVVALIIIKTIIHESFQLRWLVLISFRCHKPNLVVLFDLCALKSRQVLVTGLLTSLLA